MMFNQTHQSASSSYNDVLHLFCALSGHLAEQKLGCEFDGIDYSLVLHACSQVLEKIVAISTAQKGSNNNNKKITEKQKQKESSFIDLNKLCWIPQPTWKQQEENMKYFLECARNFSRSMSSGATSNNNNNTTNSSSSSSSPAALVVNALLNSLQANNINQEVALGSSSSFSSSLPKKLPSFPGIHRSNTTTTNSSNTSSDMSMMTNKLTSSSTNTNSNNKFVSETHLTGSDASSFALHHQQDEPSTTTDDSIPDDFAKKNPPPPSTKNNSSKKAGNDTNNNKNKNQVQQQQGQQMSLLLFIPETLRNERSCFMHHMQVQKWLYSIFTTLMAIYIHLAQQHQNQNHTNNNSNHLLLSQVPGMQQQHHHNSTNFLTSNNNNNNNNTNHTTPPNVQYFMSYYASPSGPFFPKNNPENLRSKHAEPIPLVSRSPAELLEIAEMMMEEKKGYRACWREIERMILLMLERNAEIDWDKIRAILSSSQPTKAM